MYGPARSLRRQTHERRRSAPPRGTGFRLRAVCCSFASVSRGIANIGVWPTPAKSAKRGISGDIHKRSHLPARPDVPSPTLARDEFSNSLIHSRRLHASRQYDFPFAIGFYGSVNIGGSLMRKTFNFSQTPEYCPGRYSPPCRRRPVQTQS